MPESKEQKEIYRILNVYDYGIEQVEAIQSLITKARLDELGHVADGARWFPDEEYNGTLFVSDRINELKDSSK